MSNRQHPIIILLFVASVSSLPVITQAQLSFNFTYDAANSTPPTDLNGNNGQIFDPAGNILMGMMQDAGDIWSDIIFDDWTVNVEVRWQVPTIGAGFSGQMSLYPNHPMNAGNEPAEQNNRAVWALIRVNPNRTWWVDPTPNDHSEFDMTQTLFRDLSSGVGGQQQGWYAGNTPDLLEAGYMGAVNTSAPAIMQAAGTRDLLTLALHELGHTVGIGGTQAALNEVADGDYDIPSNFVGGANMDALSESTTNAHINPSAVAGSPVLMCRCGLAGSRRLPSAIDVFAGAATAGWTDIEIQRTDFLTGNDWNVTGNWEGDRLPGLSVDAFIRHGGFVALSGPGFAGTLTLDDGSQLATSSNLLGSNAITVQNSQGVGTTLLSVASSGDVLAGEIEISANGRMFVAGAVDADHIVIDEGGEITGDGGTIDITNGTGNFINNGRIAALFDGTLTIDSDNTLDLDGNTTGEGVLEAIDGDLVFNAPVFDDFDGTATVGPGHEMTFAHGITIGDHGIMHLDGLGVISAQVHGDVFVDDGGELLGTGRAIVNDALTVQGGGIFGVGSLRTENASSELRLNGSTTLDGGTMEGPGVVTQTGDAQVTADTTITVATYDMDGQFGSSTIDVQAGHTLRVESASIEATAGDGYDGTLNINNGTVDMVQPWTLEGTVNLNDNGAGSPELTGAGLLTVSNGSINFNGGQGVISAPISVNSGTVFVDAHGSMTGPTTIGANATIEIDGADDTLTLEGQTTLIDPTIVGSGTLILEDSVNIAFADTTIGVARTDLDGLSGNTEITIHNGLTLSIASTTIEPTNNGFDGTINNHGTLSILAGWRLDGTLIMDPTAVGTATLGGGPFEIHTTGTLETRDEVLITPSTIVAGEIQVVSGRTRTSGDIHFLPTAMVDISTNGELELNGNNLFSGGTHTGNGLLQLDGPTTVDADTSISVRTVDLDGPGNTVVTLDNAALTLNVDQLDTSDNRFDGVINLNGPNARMAVSVSGGAWQMDGTLNANAGLAFAQEKLTGSPVLVTGTINVDNNAQFSAPLDISGALTLVDSSSEAWLANATHVIRNTASVSGAGQVVVADSGTLLIENGATINAEVFSLGRLEPGASIGTVLIDDDFTQTATGLLGIELSGAPSTNQDRLNVTGSANLAGELEVTVLDGPMPTLGSVYTLLTADAVVGTFDTLTMLSETIFSYAATVGYPGTRVTLTFTDVTMHGDFNDDLTLDCTDIDALVAEVFGGSTDLLFDMNGDGMVSKQDVDEWLVVAGTHNIGAPYLPGDADLDGNVNGGDFVVWNSNKFTSNPAWCSGDFTADGFVDGADFVEWNAFKFMSSDSAMVVPEPTMAHMMLLIVIVLSGIARWK